MKPNSLASSLKFAESSSFRSSSARSSSVMLRRFSIHSSSLIRFEASSLFRLMRLSSRIFQRSYSSASLISSLSSMSSMSDASFTSRSTSACLMVSTRMTFDSAFRSRRRSLVFSFALSASCSIISRSLRVSRCVLDTKTGLSIMCRRTSSSESLSYSLASSSRSSSLSSFSCFRNTFSSSSFLRRSALSRSRSRRIICVSSSSLSAPTGGANSAAGAFTSSTSSFFTDSSSSAACRNRTSWIVRCRSCLSTPMCAVDAWRRLKRLLAASSNSACFRLNRRSSLSLLSLSFALSFPLTFWSGFSDSLGS
mmetsp:Transcript_5423/g.15525  ORF Transcript_5423/g.15525 Transcript_5423/m.15525 type:complete len:309 (-) Transcript_5423:208-1134(-)